MRLRAVEAKTRYTDPLRSLMCIGDSTDYLSEHSAFETTRLPGLTGEWVVYAIPNRSL